MAHLAELSGLDATALADLVRSRSVSPLELVEATIARIEQINPSLNAIVTPMYDEARAIAAQPVSGPFAGVPFLLKDLLASYAGVRLTGGSRFLKDFVAPSDTELVARFRRAGLIVVAKTNTPEFGLLPTTEPELFGPTRNPWDVTRTPGGSSGGSAAAVAAGIVPMAHANDGGGSIRIPASCCGVFGFKPTRARVPLSPHCGDVMSGLVIEHAVTQSVRDSARLLDAIAGPDIGDPYSAPPLSGALADQIGADPGRLHIAFTAAAPTGGPVHPDCVAAVQDAAALCAELGHEVTEAAPTLDGERLVHSFTAVWAAGTAWTIDSIAQTTGLKPTPEQFERFTWHLAERGRRITASEYLLAVQALQLVGREIARFQQTYDVWLTPTLAEPPLALGTLATAVDDPMPTLMRATAFVPFTPLCNASGQPAMSVPLFWNEAGVPIGTHFVGRFGDEATLFRLAAQLEASRPWAHRRPPIGT
jgi:amidase